MSTQPSASARARHDRYGKDAARNTTASTGREESFQITGKALALVMGAILIASLFYGFQYFKSREKVNASISYVSHEVIDDHTLRVWADVVRHRPDEPAYCIVQAFDYAKSEVGRREFAVVADGQESIRVSLDIPTNARAVAGGAYGCSGNIPVYLDFKHPHYTAGKDAS